MQENRIDILANLLYSLTGSEMKRGMAIALLAIAAVSLIVTLLVRAREERIAVIPISDTIAGIS